jgi:Recombinase zinc beta ribbon domain
MRPSAGSMSEAASALASSLTETVSPVIREVFRLAGEGAPDAQIARPAHRPRADDPDRQPLDPAHHSGPSHPPLYAGRITHNGETFEGGHPHLIEPADCDPLMAARGQRDNAKPSAHGTGRPAKRHALQGLAVCGECQRRMNASTSTYRRKDGSRQRTYRCPRCRAEPHLLGHSVRRRAC